MMRSNHTVLVASLAVAGLLLPVTACSAGPETSADVAAAVGSDETTTPTTDSGDTTVTTNAATEPAFVSVVDPATSYSDAVKGVINLGLGDVQAGAASPICLSSGAGSVWAGHHRSHSMTRIDPTTGEILAEIGIDPTPGSTTKTDIIVEGAARGTGGVLANDDEVWALDIDGFAWVVDARTDEIIGRVEIPGLHAEGGLVRSDGDIFAITETGYVRIDGSTRTIEHSARLEGYPATYQSQLLAVSGGFAWIRTDEGLIRVSLADDSILEIEGASGDVAGVAGGMVWAVDEHEIIAVDATTGTVAQRIEVPESAGALQVRAPALIAGRLWAIGQARDHTGLVQVHLVRYDLAAATFDVIPVMTTNGYFVGVAPVADDAWLADWGRGNVLRVDLDDPASGTP